MAASADKEKISCAVVVNEPAEVGCVTQVHREVKEKQVPFSTGAKLDERFE
jgi:hypothetical protein